MDDPNKYGTWQEGIFARYKPKYICDSCEKYPCSADETKLMLSCPAYSPKPKPITNADSLRSLSDEELAGWVTSGIKSVLARCKGYELSPAFEQEMLDWLREETTNG